VAQVIVTPQAQRDIDDAIALLKLPGDTWSRVHRSLRVVETFPQSGRALEGRWEDARFVLGPWCWMVLLYRYEESSERVYVIAMHDARSSSSALRGDS
jgi:plasmid stabilization system protein ParE